MNTINFNNKTFSLIENSKNGQVNAETIFEYKQDGNLVTANYFGGTIKYGKIIAILTDNTLQMIYQCCTSTNELRAGRASAEISYTGNNKMKMYLNWEWLGDEEGKGISVYLEN